MTISYEVRDIIKILLKKWYIILATAAICALIAKPLSDASYQQALQQYNDNTNLELLIEKVKNNLLLAGANPEETPIEDLLPSKNESTKKPVELVTGRAYFNIKLPEYTGSDLEKKQYVENIISNIANFSYNDSFQIPLFNSIADSYNGPDFNSFKASIAFAPIKGTTMLEVTVYNISKDAFETLIQRYPVAISSFMKTLLFDDFDLSIIKTSYDQKPVELEPEQKSYEDYDRDILNRAVKKLEFNRMILKEPSIQSSRIKLMLSAALFGVLLSCAVLLIIDYIKSCHKIEMKEHSINE